MIKQRRYSRLKLGENQVRHIVVLESEPVEAKTIQSKFVQFNMLQQIHDTPSLVECGPVMFETLKMLHNGQQWVIEAEAVLPENNIEPKAS